MNKILEKFYTENKAVLDITAILLVASGLVLNINSGDGFSGISLNQVKFLLLASTIFFLSSLIWRAYAFSLSPYLGLNNKETDLILIKKLSITFFFLLIATLFTANLLIYLIISYSKIFEFFAYVIVCYSVLYLSHQYLFSSIIKKTMNWFRYIYAFYFVLIWAGIPITAYVFIIYLRPYNNLQNFFLVSIGIALLICFAVLLHIKIQSKKKG